MTTEYEFPQQPAAVIAKEIERISTELPGFQSDQRQKQMAQLVFDQSPNIVVEIGVYGGRSLIPVALAMKRNRRGMIIGIDPWDSKIHHEGLSSHNEDGDLSQEDLDNAHRKMWGAVEEYGLHDYVNIIRAKSCGVFLTPLLDKRVDILHVDGAHGAAQVERDIYMFASMVRSGGFVWMDDTTWPTVKKACRILETFADMVLDQGTYRLYKVR